MAKRVLVIAQGELERECSRRYYRLFGMHVDFASGIEEARRMIAEREYETIVSSVDDDAEVARTAPLASVLGSVEGFDAGLTLRGERCTKVLTGGYECEDGIFFRRPNRPPALIEIAVAARPGERAESPVRYELPMAA